MLLKYLAAAFSKPCIATSPSCIEDLIFASTRSFSSATWRGRAPPYRANITALANCFLSPVTSSASPTLASMFLCNRFSMSAPVLSIRAFMPLLAPVTSLALATAGNKTPDKAPPITAPSEATFNLLPNLARVLSRPSKPIKSVVWVGPEPAQSPRVVAPSVVTNTSATPAPPICLAARPNLSALDIGPRALPAFAAFAALPAIANLPTMFAAPTPGSAYWVMTSAPLPTIPSGSNPSTSLISSALSVTLSDALPPVTASEPKATAPSTPSTIPIPPETTPSTSSLGTEPSKYCSRLRPVFSSSSGTKSSNIPPLEGSLDWGVRSSNIPDI